MRVIRAHRKAPKHLLPQRLGDIKSLFLGARRLIGEKKVGGGKEKKGRRLEKLRWKDLSWASASEREGDGEGPSVPAAARDGSCGSRLIFIQLLGRTSGITHTHTHTRRITSAPSSARAALGRRPPSSFPPSCHFPAPSRPLPPSLSSI